MVIFAIDNGELISGEMVSDKYFYLSFLRAVLEIRIHSFLKILLKIPLALDSLIRKYNIDGCNV